MEEPVVLTLRKSIWNYKGEGNTNLVISLGREKIIVRLHKNDRLYTSEVDESSLVSDSEKVKREIAFWKKILVPFLGKEYFKAPMYGLIRQTEIWELNGILMEYRPKKRLIKSLGSGHVSVYPDYTFISSNFPNFHSVEVESLYLNKILSENESTFCVEIKPKQGWVFPSDRQSNCTFCLNQYHKIEVGDISKRSYYCPLDLFSGNKMRMKRALKNLLRTPQNNLKIFQDGHIIFSDSSNCDFAKVIGNWMDPKVQDEEDLLDNWSELLYRSLTKELCSSDSDGIWNSPDFFDKKTCTKTHSANVSLSIGFPPCDWTSEQLPRNCILNKILLFQKFQNSDFKTVCQLYKTLPKDTDNYFYMKELNKTNYLGSVERYLFASTAKDCSILISFKHANKLNKMLLSSSGYIEDNRGIPYYMKMGILDLDPKPLTCISKHYSRDMRIMSSYLCSKSLQNHYLFKNVNDCIS